jgi:hypothetical protein
MPIAIARQALERRSQQAELVAFGVAHDRDAAAVQLLASSGVAPTERNYPVYGSVDVFDENVDVEADFADLEGRLI